MMPFRHGIAVLLFVCVDARYEPFAFPVRPCEGVRFFDISALACVPCPASQVPNAAGTGCVCEAGRVLDGTTCIVCNATGGAPTRDRTACLPCATSDGSTSTVIADANSTITVAPEEVTLGLIDGECSCPSGKVVVERDGHGGLLDAKRCRPCPTGTFAASASECRACPRPHMVAALSGTSGGGCVCAPSYREFSHANGWWGHEQTCVDEKAYGQLEAYYSAAALTMRYADLPASQPGTLTVDASKIMQQLLLPAAVDCLLAVTASSTSPRAQSFLDGNQACQAVGNLCVLMDYNQRSTACTLYEELQSRAVSTGVSVNPEWRQRMPGLYYADAGIRPISVSAPAIDTTLALPPAAGSRMRYVLAPYSLNGTFLGLVELTTQLQLCSGGAASPSDFLNFGTSMRVSCNVPPTDLLEVTEPIFYDLYFYYDEGTTTNAERLPDLDSGYLYPVPVRLLNYRVDGQRVNDDTDGQGRLLPFNDQLTRRFFTVDAASAVTARGQMPRVVRYIKSATLSATLRNPDSTTGFYEAANRINPPYLEIEYGDVAIPSTASSPISAQALLAADEIELSSSFAATYVMDAPSETLNILFVFALGVWLLLTIGKGVMLFRRNQSASMDGYMMLRMLAAAADCFASVFFTLLLIISVWWFVAYKGQTELYILMPAELPPALYLGIMPFQVFVVTAFAAKCLHILDVLHVQTQHDLFFLDWEQPRALRTDGGDDDDEPRGRGGESASGGKDSQLPVSVWRTIFVANEWAKLQDVRAISMEVNLIALLFLLRGVGVEDFARLVPNGPGEVGVPFHMLLRFALSSSLLLALSLVQWLFRYAFWERYVKDRVWQFVDLLAVTNVSCLLLEEHHFGFYLHGRSVHDHADADMAQLNANLKREEEGLEMLRGFRQDSTVQTFEVYLSPSVRQRYDAAFAGGGFEGNMPRNNRRRAGGRGPDGAGGNTRQRGFRAAPEEGVQRHRELNRFLMTYLGTPTGNNDGGNSTEGARPEVRRKRYWEQLIGLPPEALAASNRSVFLEDTSGRFKRLLLAGREADMMLLGILTYAVFDMATSNSFVAIFATYAMDVVVRAVRAELATRNIAAKTLLDDRFLL